MKRWIIVGVVVAVAVGGGWWGWRTWSERNGVVRYREATADRGDVVQNVRATGVVQPLKVVQVGTQVNGPILKLYVDYNSRVKADQIVAQIDPVVYEARLAQDDANLQQSLASVDQARARLVQADNELARSKELAKRDLISGSDLDAAVASRDSLAAELKVAQARVAQGEAALRLSKANLSYTTIRAPVDGIVLSRSVNEGQTVVASMSAQTIFAIATDLSHMQIQASIPEADIGKVRRGQTVTFSVDAYDREFTGTVDQIWLAAETVQNVVTYPVIIMADNPDDMLFPSMTANISCEVARQTDVLRVPNAALRFKPENAEGEKERPAAPSDGNTHKTGVWNPAPSGPKFVQLTTGITDGSFTEIAKGELKEGQAVIVGILAADAKDAKKSGVVNPFVPQRPAGGGRPR